MYSLGVVLMYTQAVQEELGRESENYQVINAAAGGTAGRENLSFQPTRFYRSMIEKVSRLSNSRQNEIKVARSS